MTSERKPGIIYSQASLPPQISIFASSETISRYLNKTEAEGVEILPTWGISGEILLYGKLKNSESASSFHQSWMKDFGIEKRYGQGTAKIDYIIRPVFFPFVTQFSDRAMRKLWRSYPQIPTTVHTLDSDHTLGRRDGVSFYLELAHQNGIKEADLLWWIGQRPNIRGIVFPSRDDQLIGWAERYATALLGRPWQEIAEGQLPYMKSVHLGPLATEEIEMYLRGEFALSQTEERLKFLYERGFRHDAVIEVDPRKIARVSKSQGINLARGYSLVVTRFKKLRDRFSS